MLANKKTRVIITLVQTSTKKQERPIVKIAFMRHGRDVENILIQEGRLQVEKSARWLDRGRKKWWIVSSETGKAIQSAMVAVIVFQKSTRAPGEHIFQNPQTLAGIGLNQALKQTGWTGRSNVLVVTHLPVFVWMSIVLPRANLGPEHIRRVEEYRTSQGDGFPNGFVLVYDTKNHSVVTFDPTSL